MAFDSSKRYHILFDAFPLRSRLTGLGQFCYNLLSEYGVQAEQNMEFSAFLRKEWIPNLEGLSVKIHKAGWIQRHHQDWMAGFFFGKYDLWHISEELARIVSAPKKTKVALTIHGLHFLDEGSEEQHEKKLKKVQSLADRADIVITNSDATTAAVKKNMQVPDSKLHRIYLGVSIAKESKKPAWAPREKFLFTVGSFLVRKNFHVLVPMIKELPFKLVMAGKFIDDYPEFIRQEAVKWGVEEQVLIRDEISEAEKNWCFQNCEAFVFPSISEGFGIPIVEALYFGKPIFLSRFGSLPEIGKDYAYYWDNFSPQEMAQKVKENIHSPIHINERRDYALSYSWAKAAKEYLTLYRSLLN